MRQDHVVDWTPSEKAGRNGSATLGVAPVMCSERTRFLEKLVVDLFHRRPLEPEQWEMIESLQDKQITSVSEG